MNSQPDTHESEPRTWLLAAEHVVGSVHPRVIDHLWHNGCDLKPLGGSTARAWQLGSNPTQKLETLTMHLQQLWPHAFADSNERLSLWSPTGERLGSVLRGSARLLGLQTHSVHLLLAGPNQHWWLQLRSSQKTEDPMAWDTTVGGTVTDLETPLQCLSRELWEEASLRVQQLQDILPTSAFSLAPKRCGPDGLGLQRETVHPFLANTSPHAVPVNRDGEVQMFQLWQVPDAPCTKAQPMTRVCQIMLAQACDTTTPSSRHNNVTELFYSALA